MDIHIQHINPAAACLGSEGVDVVVAHWLMVHQTRNKLRWVVREEVGAAVTRQRKGGRMPFDKAIASPASKL